MSLWIQIWIVATARNASKQAARRSHRTTKQRYFFWNQAKVRSAGKRGTTCLIGLPRFFFVFQTRFGICARISCFRSCCRSAFASYPLSVAITLRCLRGRPRLPVCTLTASSNGTTCARSSPLAGVTRFAKGIPRPSVRLWMRIPLPFLPWATPSPPPFPGGKSAIDGAILLMNHPAFLSNAKDPRLHRGQRAIRLPPLQPAMRRTLGGPLRPPGRITPATTRHQDVEQCIEYLPKRYMRHPTSALRRCRGKNVLKQTPLQITHTFKSSCHTAFLHSDRTV